MNPSDALRTWPGKRAFDVGVSVLLLLLLLPFFVIVSLAVKLTSRGPVFFRQERVGYGGRGFTMLKFRTMHVDAEERLFRERHLYALYESADHKIPNVLDPRVTSFGRWLRESSVDELPQLLNVLLGHMSLVGPRPVIPREVPCYGELVDVYLSLRPGLTGLWQTTGRNNIRFPRRAELDMEYFHRCSLGLDLALLLRTPVAVVSRRGAN